MLTKKDVISFNQKFDKGNFNNESSLDFALNLQKQHIAWTKKLAYLARAILIDHVFEEGNKRTAAAVLFFYAEHEGYSISDAAAVKIIKSILFANTTSIAKIRGMIENAITKKD